MMTQPLFGNIHVRTANYDEYYDQAHVQVDLSGKDTELTPNRELGDSFLISMGTGNRPLAPGDNDPFEIKGYRVRGNDIDNKNPVTLTLEDIKPFTAKLRAYLAPYPSPAPDKSPDKISFETYANVEKTRSAAASFQTAIDTAGYIRSQILKSLGL